MNEKRIEEIVAEWGRQADRIGVVPAVRELAVALDRTESECDDLKDRLPAPPPEEP